MGAGLDLNPRNSFSKRVRLFRVALLVKHRNLQTTVFLVPRGVTDAAIMHRSDVGPRGGEISIEHRAPFRRRFGTCATCGRQLEETNQGSPVCGAASEALRREQSFFVVAGHIVPSGGIRRMGADPTYGSPRTAFQRIDRRLGGDSGNCRSSKNVPLRWCGLRETNARRRALVCLFPFRHESAWRVSMRSEHSSEHVRFRDQTRAPAPSRQDCAPDAEADARGENGRKSGPQEPARVRSYRRI